MYLSAREFWGVVHGMVLGALFLLAYGGRLAGLYSLRPDWVTPAGVRERLMRLKLGAWGMTIAAWLTVLTGTWLVYPWYRAKPPADADLRFFPRAYLLTEAHRIVTVARATLDTAEFCFLTTQGEFGPTSTRLMQHFKPDADLTVWFGTSLTSRKVREIQRNPRVTVACLDPTRRAYTVLVGTVTIEERAEQWRRYWRDDWQTFWPEGPSGRDYVPLRFACERVEVLSFAAGIAPAPYGLRPAVAVRHGDRWQLAGG